MSKKHIVVSCNSGDESAETGNKLSLTLDGAEIAGVLSIDIDEIKPDSVVTATIRAEVKLGEV